MYIQHMYHTLSLIQDLYQTLHIWRLNRMVFLYIHLYCQNSRIKLYLYTQLMYNIYSLIFTKSQLMRMSHTQIDYLPNNGKIYNYLGMLHIILLIH